MPKRFEGTRLNHERADDCSGARRQARFLLLRKSGDRYRDDHDRFASGSNIVVLGLVD
jgi:hypothetical protein